MFKSITDVKKIYSVFFSRRVTFQIWVPIFTTGILTWDYVQKYTFHSTMGAADSQWYAFRKEVHLLQ